MAHEMGHNFGSPVRLSFISEPCLLYCSQHDPESSSVCVPGGEDGNYIMYARATAGDKNNNKQFSLCSLQSINTVLQVKATGPTGCFNGKNLKTCINDINISLTRA